MLNYILLRIINSLSDDVFLHYFSTPQTHIISNISKLDSFLSSSFFL